MSRFSYHHIDQLRADLILRPYAATDDVGLIFENDPAPDPANPNRLVFVENRNTTIGVVVTVAWTGDSNFELISLDGARRQPFSPLQQQIRIPPGGKIFVGLETFYKAININDRMPILRTFEIVGAQFTANYKDALPDTQEIPSWMFIYTARAYADEPFICYTAVNQNMEFGVSVGLRIRRPDGTLIGTGATANPSGQALFCALDFSPHFEIDFQNSFFFR